jgi:prepilin peptidase CpaA
MAGTGLIALCAAAAISDLLRRRVPNALNLSILLSGLAFQLTTGGAAGLGMGLFGSAIGLCLLIAPFAMGWLGGGDVKLASALGAWLGPALIAPAILWGLALGGVLALAIAARDSQLGQTLTTLRISLVTFMPPPAPSRAGRLAVPLALPLAAVGAVLFITKQGLF